MNPLFRFLERETIIAQNLLNDIKIDLAQLKRVAEGEIKSTNELKKITKELLGDQIPKKW